MVLNLSKLYREGLPGYYWDHFERSVPMSSYLVAMCVADFSFVEAKTDEGIITFRLWARHSAINQTKSLILICLTLFWIVQY